MASIAASPVTAVRRRVPAEMDDSSRITNWMGKEKMDGSTKELNKQKK
jgi:hypothetical protein